MLQLKHIKKEYKSGTLIQKALDDVSLNLRDNEFVAILGPSGSGKTTLLNIIGGLDHYDEGDLIINNISTKKYKDRDWDAYRNHTIGFVFQSYNLIPHQSVLANVELALTISGIKGKERKKRALEALEAVGLKEQAHKLPNQMSGGQMQRVAIARALVNNPDILLADEPTGALDSDTSIQVMDLLKEVAKDRLVVMVTHNPELAYKYATRIVELKDGKIQSDSHPYNAVEEETARHQKMARSSMSLLTSLQLSFNNLKTKKARTLLTSFAGSIGIIGIALILSISTGVNEYIRSIEQDTLSEYPLSITSSGINLSAMMEDGDGEKENNGEIVIADMVTNLFKTFEANDLAALKDYLDNGDSDIAEYVRAIEYSYNVTPYIYSADTSDIHQVNPDQSFQSLGLGSAGSGNNMMSAMMSTDVFFELPANKELYEDQYDIKAGHWPNNYNECVLVLTSGGRMSDFLLYALDLRDYHELEAMVDEFAQNDSVTVPENNESYNYSDILGHTFKLVYPFDYYVYDEAYDVYIDKSEDEEHLKELIEKGETLTIVGIVEPKEGGDVAMLTSGIGYPYALTEHIIEAAENNDAVQKQLNHPDIDIFTGKNFGDDQNIAFDMNSLFSVDEDMMAKAFNFDQSKIDLNALNLDLSNITIDLSLKDINLKEIIGDLNLDFKDEDIKIFSDAINQDFNDYCLANNLNDPERYEEYFKAYIALPEKQEFIAQNLQELLVKSGLDEEYLKGLNDRLNQVISNKQSEIMNSLATAISEQMKGGLEKIMADIPSAFSFDSSVFQKAISFNMDQEELSELLTSLMVNASSSYEGNLRNLGYADITKPSTISIYPKDFESKQEVVGILDAYNKRMAQEDEDKVISYTDYVGALMSSVTDIIDVISYVLIAFVAISLIVSSIMIGVITYISVLERKKEIGILRAIGASKRNVGTVFNAETFIVGLLSGVMGIIISLVLLIPINEVIHSLAGSVDVSAKLPFVGAVALIILSTLLTIIGGLLPASKASKEDPVKALRTE